jgi:hypothetical protein
MLALWHQRTDSGEVMRDLSALGGVLVEFGAHRDLSAHRRRVVRAWRTPAEFKLLVLI